MKHQQFCVSSKHDGMISYLFLILEYIKCYIIHKTLAVIYCYQLDWSSLSTLNFLIICTCIITLLVSVLHTIHILIVKTWQVLVKCEHILVPKRGLSSIISFLTVISKETIPFLLWFLPLFKPKILFFFSHIPLHSSCLHACSSSVGKIYDNENL